MKPDWKALEVKLTESVEKDLGVPCEGIVIGVGDFGSYVEFNCGAVVIFVSRQPLAIGKIVKAKHHTVMDSGFEWHHHFVEPE
jgi:hypothetical protein